LEGSSPRLQHLVPLAALTRLEWLFVKLGVTDDDGDEEKVGLNNEVRAKPCQRTANTLAADMLG
jgi:hypothetical protein